MSPPVSPHDAPHVSNLPQVNVPPSYEMAFLTSAERQRRIHQHLSEVKQITDQLSELGKSRKLTTISESNMLFPLDYLLPENNANNTQPPLSPISEAVTEDINSNGPSSKRPESISVSDESVAGDSGVYEATVAGSANEMSLASMSLETAQVQIKLRYAMDDGLLHIGIERAGNLAALFIPENRKM